MQKFDHNIGFWEKNANFFCRTLAKIAVNCDHNIDTWTQSYDRDFQRQRCNNLQRHGYSSSCVLKTNISSSRYLEKHTSVGWAQEFFLEKKMMLKIIQHRAITKKSFGAIPLFPLFLHWRESEPGFSVPVMCTASRRLLGNTEPYILSKLKYSE
jgi:hypothetical protein